MTMSQTYEVNLLNPACQLNYLYSHAKYTKV